MKAFIFSNCKKNDLATHGKNLLAKVPKDALLVILNKGNVYYKVKEFTQYKNQIIILRSCGSHGLQGFFGLQDLVGSGRNQYIKEVICFAPQTETADVIIGKKDETVEKKQIKIPWMKKYEEATNGKAATTGYAAYYLIQDLYGIKPDDITLVNFYGNADSSTGKWNGHDWSYEDTWIHGRKRIFC